MMNRKIVLSLIVVMVVWAGAPGWAEPEVEEGGEEVAQSERTREDQFLEVARARTEAELAVRRGREYLTQAENTWRTVTAETDAARQRAQDGIGRAIADEQRKAEELRNAAVIEQLGAQRDQINRDWQQFHAVQRPEIEGRWRAAGQQATSIVNLYNSVAGLESSWKDNQMDLSALAGMFMAVTRRAEEIRGDAEAAMGDLRAHHKVWNDLADAASIPGRAER